MTFIKKFCLGFLAAVCAVCFVFSATAIFDKKEVKADTTELEKEFTNDGQFEITTSAWNNTFEFIDGTAVGGTGAALQVNVNAGVAAFKVDFSSSGLLAENVDSIVVRIKAANFTLGADEFRTDKNAGSSWINYGKADDLSVWHNYTLNSATMAQLTNEDGTLGSTNIAIRTNNNDLVAYIDKIKINEKVDTEALETEFTNNGQFSLLQYSNIPYKYVVGANEELTEGYSGAVVKVNNINGNSVYVTVDYSSLQILAKNVESIVVRIYSPEYTSADEFRTLTTGSGDTTQRFYGAGVYDMSTWCDIPLNADSIADMTDSDGYLTSLSVGVRIKSSAKVYYIDSITLTEKVDTEALETEFTNNGQFALLQYSNIPYKYVVGANEELTEGYSGAVVKVNNINGNSVYVTVDYSSLQILAKNVESIVVRIYSPEYTSADEFRTLTTGSGDTTQRFYGAGVYDMSTWCDIPLNADSIADMTDSDGYLTSLSVGIRIKSGATVYYIDSITLTEKTSTSVNYLKIEWNNKGYGEFEGKKGVLIKYDANLSDVKSEINGGLQTVNLIEEYGKYITLNGEVFDTVAGAELIYHSQGFLWIYAPDMTVWENRIPVLEVEENAPFLNAILPALTLYFNADANKWQTERLTLFAGVDSSSSAKSIVLKYTDDVVWTEDIGNVAELIVLDGKTLAEDGGTVSVDTTDKIITVNTNGTYGKFAVSDGAVCGNVEIPRLMLSVIDGVWTRVYSYTGTKIESSNGFLDHNNYLGSDNLYATTFDFDAKVMDWNKYPTVVSGIRVNGIEIGSSNNDQLGVRLIQLTDGLWIKFRANLESGYKGYSHPTITFGYGAYIETENYERVYFDEVELYLADGVWTTSVPDGYVIIKPTTFAGIDGSSSENAIVLKFSDDGVWTEDAGDIAEHIYLDGKTLTEENGSVSVDAATKTITLNINGSDNKYGTVKITASAKFGEITLPEIILYGMYDGAWGDGGHFECTDLIGWYENLRYVEIPYGWNCLISATNIVTILRFGNYEKHYFADDPDANNQANSVGDGITINGVPIGQIAGAEVSYAHGFNHLFISVPAYELCPNDEYKCVELHVKENAAFKDVYLGEVFLYLVNGQWQTEKPTTVDNDAEGTYMTAEDIFNGEAGGYFENGVYILTDEDDDKEIISSEKATPDGIIYNFLYKSDSVDFDYSLFTYVKEGFGGVRITGYRNPNESTQGFNVYIDGQFEASQQVAFVSDEWYAVRLAVTFDSGKIGVSVAVDGIEIINVTADHDGEIGDEIKIRKSYGTLTFADFRTGDIKKPVINWQGKKVSKFTAGEEKPSDTVFTRVLSATDNYDKVNFSADEFNIEWQDGAIEDGKLVAGEWTVTISVSDKAGNVAYYTATALVIDPDEITVAFDVDGKVVYAAGVKGALIEKPADPVKEGDNRISYVFDGWYYGENKWDFVNDYALNDIELKAVFKTEYKEYSVTVVSKGLDNNYEYAFKLRYGSVLDESVLTRDGYTYKLTENGETIDKITVKGDLRIVAVYTADYVPPETKGGCGGSVSGSAFGAATVMIACIFISVKKISNKRGKEHE